MIPLDPNHLDALEWLQPSAFSRSYELRGGDSLFGTLAFTKLTGSLAEGHVADTAWSFKRSGFFQPVATARVAGTEQEVAVYQPHWPGGKGQLTLASGERLFLHKTGFWGGDWGWYAEGDLSLILFQSHGVFHHGAAVSVQALARERQDLLLLLLFGWYILLLHQQDAAAAVIMTG